MNNPKPNKSNARQAAQKAKKLKEQKNKYRYAHHTHTHTHTPATNTQHTRTHNTHTQKRGHTLSAGVHHHRQHRPTCIPRTQPRHSRTAHNSQQVATTHKAVSLRFPRMMKCLLVFKNHPQQGRGHLPDETEQQHARSNTPAAAPPKTDDTRKKQHAHTRNTRTNHTNTRNTRTNTIQHITHPTCPHVCVQYNIQ